jgi:hypothetical protein
MADNEMSATRIKAEALAILTAPGGPCDPFDASVKNPDMLAQMIKEFLDIFVSQNPQPSGRSPEELADAFLHHMAERKWATP